MGIKPSGWTPRSQASVVLWKEIGFRGQTALGHRFSSAGDCEILQMLTYCQALGTLVTNTESQIYNIGISDGVVPSYLL